jgi:hypothetical protein
MFERNLCFQGIGGFGWHSLRCRRIRCCLAGIVLSLLSSVAFAESSVAGLSDVTQGTSSAAERRSAVQSIPFDKLDNDSRGKVNSVLSNVSIYRRLPIRVVNCDPDLYLFLVRHPDIVVNIWEILGVAQLQMRQIDIDTFRIAESEGTSATLEYLYHSRDTQIVFGKWTYTGPLLARRITGSCLAVLKTDYKKESDGKYYITSRLDGFLSVNSGGAEMLARTVQPLVVKNVDNNFIQTIAFLGSMSKTAEVNLAGMRGLAARLSRVSPETRQQLADVVTSVSQRSVANTANSTSQQSSPRVAGRPQEERSRQ